MSQRAVPFERGHQQPTVIVVGASADQPPPGLVDALGEEASLVFADSSSAMRRELGQAEVAYVADFQSTLLEETWEAARRLDWVHVGAAGVDAVLFPALRDSDTTLTNARGVFDDAIAEYVLGLLLAFAKDLPGTLRRQHQAEWDHRESERLAGRHLVVVGAGPIGRAIAGLTTAVGMTVEGVARTARDDDPDFGEIVATTDLDQALGRADYVVLAVPLTPQTRGMIGRDELAAMPPGARLINIARGEVVDQAALLAALEAGELAGAGLDVFEQEPLPPDSPLWHRPDVIVSPHMSGDFLGWRRALTEVFVDNFHRWRDERPLINVVDKRRGYVPTDQ